MNPLTRKRVEQQLVDELKLCAGGEPPTKAFLRQSIGCSPAELAAAIQSLRYQGKLAWDGLELSPSMADAAPCAAEGGAAPAPRKDGAAPPSIGPEDGPEDDYPGEVNDEASEGPQAEQGSARREPLPPESAAGDGAVPLRRDERAVSGGRVEEPRPDRAVDQPAGDRREVRTGFASKRLLHAAGVHAANTRAAAKPLPAPRHESEVARAVREEVNEIGARRHLARSTATVRQPLGLEKTFGLADLTVSVASGCMLTEDPKAVMRAVSRKHPALWRRCILLSRIAGKSPMESLYDALEAGLDELEGTQSLDMAGSTAGQPPAQAGAA